MILAILSSSGKLIRFLLFLKSILFFSYCPEQLAFRGADRVLGGAVEVDRSRPIASRNRRHFPVRSQRMAGNEIGSSFLIYFQNFFSFLKDLEESTEWMGRE